MIRFARALVVACLPAMAPFAAAQSSSPAVFVSNNGNLEGSVSSFHVESDGTLTLVQKLVTGTRESTQDPCPGCNSYEISLSPNGRWLATGHAAGEDLFEQVTIYEVAADATMLVRTTAPIPGSVLDVQWLSDTVLAVTRTDFGASGVQTYTFDGLSLTLADDVATGGFTTYLAAHPTLPVLYAQDSNSPYSIQAYDVAPNGVLTIIDTEFTGSTFPLELAVTHDGTKLYAAGGISNGGDKVIGLRVGGDGSLSPLGGSPFVSPGASPSNTFASDDDKYLLVGHGTDATVRTFGIDPLTGGVAPTGFVFDVGLQGTLGDVRTSGDLVFMTDNSTAIDGIRGIYSFTLGPDGSLASNGPIVSTDGIGPRAIAAWQPAPCPGDIAPAGGDGMVDISDLLALLAAWGPCPPPCDPDLDGDGLVDIADLLDLLEGWGPCVASQ
jgi:6-phosphogluconolactonase (cycloisomerase 2 family)